MGLLAVEQAREAGTSLHPLTGEARRGSELVPVALVHLSVRDGTFLIVQISKKIPEVCLLAKRLPCRLAASPSFHGPQSLSRFMSKVAEDYLLG